MFEASFWLDVRQIPGINGALNVNALIPCIPSVGDTFKFGIMAGSEYAKSYRVTEVTHHLQGGQVNQEPDVFPDCKIRLTIEAVLIGD